MMLLDARCARPHFEDHHVRMIQSLRTRVAQAQEELEKANARMAYLADQLDSLARDCGVPR
jgi:uncharacterized coiled-coil protein SlyX